MIDPEAVVADILAGNFEAVVNLLSERARAQVSAEALAEAWRSLAVQFAAVTGYERRSELSSETTNVFRVAFERGAIDISLTTDDTSIIGLWFRPPASDMRYAPPGYVRPDQFDAEDCNVGIGQLKGKLCVPRGRATVPGVVLVHGSGPLDMDARVGAIRPFLDIAWGLASQGIAVLRFDKRTFSRPDLMPPTGTVMDETVDDAAAAVSLLTDHPRVDSQRIAVVGHSLGGMVAGRIGLASHSVAGFVLLAAAARPLEDLLLEQMRYLGVAESTLAEITAQVACVKSDALSTDTPSSSLPFGVPASYWLDLRSFDPVRSLAAIGKPVLCVQGGRDYQVTSADYDLWRAGLAADSATFKLHKRCNHVFVEGKGASTPAEYERPGNVARGVMKDLASWIRSL